jgi:hypothetical protein
MKICTALNFNDGVGIETCLNNNWIFDNCLDVAYVFVDVIDVVRQKQRRTDESTHCASKRL